MCKRYESADSRNKFCLFLGDIKIHPVGIMEAEEDDWIMMHIGLTQLLMILFPCGGCCLNPLVGFDTESEKNLPCKLRSDIVKFYQQCVQRHLHALRLQNPKLKVLPVFVSKNPAFTMRINSLLSHFPNAKVVCVLRNPETSVPSMISYISHVRTFRIGVRLRLSIAVRY